MKKISAAFLILATFMVFAQGLKFDESNFASLQKKAKAEHKLIFVDAYAEWCGPCKLMAKNVFTQQEVGDYYNANFINAKIDMEKGEGRDLAKKYKVMAYPTYLFIDGNGEVIHRVTGYYDAPDFIKIGQDANNPAKQMGALKTRFEKGDTDPQFLKDFMKVYIYSDRALATKAAEKYFAGKKGQELNPEDYQYLFALTPNSTSPLFQVIVDRKAEFLKAIPESTYNEIIAGYKLATVMNTAFNKDTKTLNDAIFLREAGKIMPKDEAQEALLKTKMKIAESQKNHGEYQKLAIQYYQDGSSPKFNSNELNSVAWYFFENITDRAALQKALVWSKESVKKEEGYANTDTVANLYFKLGDKKNAKLWAERSIALAKASNEDYSSTQKLLNQVK